MLPLMKHVLVTLMVLALPNAAPAQILTAVDALRPVELRIADGWREEEGTRMAALVFDLAPGWKTYWRAPGELGIPPSFDWSGSGNLAEVEPVWPAPEVFEAAGMPYPGYAGRLVLPLRVTPVDPAAPVRLSVSMVFGVCEDVCMPADAVLSAELRLADAPGPEAPAIEAALARRAVDAGEAGLRRVACRLQPDGHAVRLEAMLEFEEAPRPRMIALETGLSDLWVAPVEMVRSEDRIEARTRLEYFGTEPLAIERDGLIITLISQGRAVELRGCPEG